MLRKRKQKTTKVESRQLLQMLRLVLYSHLVKTEQQLRKRKQKTTIEVESRQFLQRLRLVLYSHLVKTEQCWEKETAYLMFHWTVYCFQFCHILVPDTSFICKFMPCYYSIKKEPKRHLFSKYVTSFWTKITYNICLTLSLQILNKTNPLMILG